MAQSSNLQTGFYFAESQRHKNAIYASKIRPFLNYISKNDVVLDAGCGVGIELSMINDKVKFAVGLDIDISNLKLTREFLNERQNRVDLIRSDIYHLPFKDSSFSGIMLFDVLEHLFSPEKVVANLTNLMQPKGKFFIRIPNKWTIDEFLLSILSKIRHERSLWNVRHVSFYSLRSIKEVLKKHRLHYVHGYVTGNFWNNLSVSIITMASIPLNIIFSKEYYKSRYYIMALSSCLNTKDSISFIKKTSSPLMPSYNYFTLVFSYLE